jgi:hypothetical protein
MPTKSFAARATPETVNQACFCIPSSTFSTVASSIQLDDHSYANYKDDDFGRTDDI